MTIEDVKPKNYNYANHPLEKIVADAVVDAGQSYANVVKQVLPTENDSPFYSTELGVFLVTCASCGEDTQHKQKLHTQLESELLKLKVGDLFPKNSHLSERWNTIICWTCYSAVKEMIEEEYKLQKESGKVYEPTASGENFSVKALCAHGNATKNDGSLPHGNGYHGHWHR